MISDTLLTLNPGSSTIKLGLFTVTAHGPQRLGAGMVDLRHTPLTLHVAEGGRTTDIVLHTAVAEGLQEAVEETLGLLTRHFGVGALAMVGHRVVHGGDRFTGPVLVTDDTLAAIEALVPLAPLHQPQSVRLIRAIRRLQPGLPQAASFDTAFHRTQSDQVRRFALPRTLFDGGIKRYGFHGLSYAYIATELARWAPDIARGRVVVAHLGSGASLCALHGGISRDTSMGFSTLDGVPMATRCGAVDPGVLIHLLKHKQLSVADLEDMLYHRSGLLGMSGISADTRELLGSTAPAAREAIAVFTLRIAREMAALATTLGGLDGIVFTAGIGEHQPAIRAAVCAHLKWLGVSIDPTTNAADAARIDSPLSKVAIFVIPTDEEQVIAAEAASVRPRPPEPQRYRNGSGRMVGGA